MLQETLSLAQEIRSELGIAPIQKATPSRVQNTDYDAIDAIRNTELGHIEKTPAHWRAYKDNKIKKTEVLITGTMMHYAILEPHKLAENWCVKADGRTTVGKAENKANLAMGKILITEKEFEMIHEVSENLKNDKDIQEIFKGALIERHYTFNWLGELCKCKPDILKPNELVCDLKFVKDANPRKFLRNAEQYGYDRQAAFYNVGLEAHKLWNPSTKNFIIAIEKEPPYAYSIIEIDPFVLKQGREKARECVERIKSIKEGKDFPSYGKAKWTLNL